MQLSDKGIKTSFFLIIEDVEIARLNMDKSGKIDALVFFYWKLRYNNQGVNYWNEEFGYGERTAFSIADFTESLS